MANDCWPDWLQRLNRDRYGPNFGYPQPYPVYTVQSAVLSEQNPNVSAQQLSDAFYQHCASTIPTADLATRIVHVMPNNPFDTIAITAFVTPKQAGNNAPGVPIFFSFDRPGRIVTEVEIQGSQEAMLATCNAFVATDPSSFANCIIMPQQVSAADLASLSAVYTVALFPTTKTNRPFYFWFNDGIAQLPAAGGTVGFKASWYVQGR